jgi:hypothetical protein
MSMNVGAVSQSLGAMAARFNPMSATSKPSGPLAGRVTNGHRSPLRMVGLVGLLVLGFAAGACASPGGGGTARTAGNTGTSGPSYSAAANAITPVMGQCVTKDGTTPPEVGLNESGDLRFGTQPGNNHVRAHDVNGGVLISVGSGTGNPTTVCVAQQTAQAGPNGPATFSLDGQPFSRPIFELAGNAGSFHTGALPSGADEATAATVNDKVDTLVKFTDGVTVNGASGRQIINGSGVKTDFYADGGAGNDELTGGGYPVEVPEGEVPVARSDVLNGMEGMTGNGQGAEQAPDVLRYRLPIGTVADESQKEYPNSVSELNVGAGDTTKKIQ